ncbi:hypothetical protein PENSPDRAFT_501333 [Peniophora sp. CONT]|nr:hypothetical protein PENSPDRAFT_501333 [Peniophora sp. CONT]
MPPRPHHLPLPLPSPCSTDDRLVDAHGLPTERLMSLFRPPAALSVGIDPQSTLSPTCASAELDHDSDKDEPPTPPRSSVSTGRKSKSRGPPMGTFSTVRRESLAVLHDSLEGCSRVH